MRLWTNKHAGVDIKQKKFTEVDLPDKLKWVYLEKTKTILKMINNEFEGLVYTKTHIKYYKSQGAIFKGIELNGDVIGLFSILICPVKVFSNFKNVSEVNFLCIKKPFRNKGYINYLVSEIIRLSVLNGVSSGYYTSTSIHPNLKMVSNFFHLPVNCKKLVELDFMPDIKYSFEKGVQKKTPITTEIIERLNNFCTKYSFSKIYTIFHPKLFDCYSENENIIVFYKLKFKMNGKFIENAYIYSYSYSDITSFCEFIKKCIVNYDVVTCLDKVMDNSFITEYLKFLKGDSINYYFFNESVGVTTNLINF